MFRNRLVPGTAGHVSTDFGVISTWTKQLISLGIAH